MKWQAHDKQVLRANPRRGIVYEIQDFSENGSIKPKNEHQSRYFCEVGYTLYGVVLRIHIDDAGNITDEEREKLRKLFADNGLAPVITETHCIVSADLGHDQVVLHTHA